MKFTKGRNFWLACVLLMLSAAINVYFAFVLQKIIDSTVTKHVGDLLQAIGFSILIMLLDMIITITSRYVEGKYIQNTLEEIKGRKFFSSLTFFTKRETAKEDIHMASFSSDIDIVENNYLRSQLNIVFYSTQFILGVCAMISINLIVTLGITVVTLIPVLIPSFFKKIVQKRKLIYSRQSGEYLAYINESLSGRYEIRDYDKSNVFMKKHFQENHKLENARFQTKFIDSVVGIMAGNFGFLTFVTGIGLSCYFVIKGEMTFGYMIAIVQLMNSLVQPLNSVTSSLNLINSSKKVLENYEPKQETAPILHKKVDDSLNNITISNLSFSYDMEHPVIEHFNYRFEKGKNYVLVGPSGCGKSTLAKVLAMDIKDYDGVVQVDGYDIREINEKSYRNLVRYVRQDSFIFTDTILNNIVLYEDDHSSDQLQQAIQLAKVVDFASDEAAMSKVVSNKNGISGGQKQRISLARSLLRRPQILLLDEITASIDLETSYEIYKNLVQLEDTMCIVITHQQDQRILELFDEVVSFAPQMVSMV